MLRTDAGNFNRFLTSLGILLVAGALVVPYFYFRNTEILMIPRSDLRGMTDTARASITGRQDAIAALEPWVVGGAILLAVGGALLLVTGGLRLKAAQKNEDEETKLRRDRARLELDEMSPAERAEQAAEKAEEGVTQGQPPTAETGGPSAATSTARLRRMAVERISMRIRDAFEAAEAPGYQPKWQVRLSATTGSIRLDGVFESPNENQPDVVLEIRVASDLLAIKRNARNVADDLIAKLGRYEAMTHRPSKGWLVYVIPEESESEPGVDALDESRDSLGRALWAFGHAAVLPESQINLLPERFKQQFSAEGEGWLRW